MLWPLSEPGLAKLISYPITPCFICLLPAIPLTLIRPLELHEYHVASNHQTLDCLFDCYNTGLICRFLGFGANFATGNSPVTGEFPWQRPVNRSFGVVFDLLNERLIEQSWGWGLETPTHSSWRHCNEKQWPRIVWEISEKPFLSHDFREILSVKDAPDGW